MLHQENLDLLQTLSILTILAKLRSAKSDKRDLSIPKLFDKSEINQPQKLSHLSLLSNPCFMK